MHLLRKTRRITMLVGTGAVAAYFLDPDNGEARRQHIVDQVRGLMGGEELAPGAMQPGAFEGSGFDSAGVEHDAGFGNPASNATPGSAEPLPPLEDALESSLDDDQRTVVGEALSGQHSHTI